jgi:ribosome-associated toxin RatA of RatAB toxin-antitoxin module
MDIHFNATRIAGASGATLFDVITDYVNYPKFNPALIHVSVVRRDDDGAEFVADRKTVIGKRVHAHDRYERGEDLVINRTYAGSPSARSTWTIHPVDADSCTLTVDAWLRTGQVQGMVLKPFLRKLFYGINFTPFIQEAERRAAAAQL